MILILYHDSMNSMISIPVYIFQNGNSKGEHTDFFFYIQYVYIFILPFLKLFYISHSCFFFFYCK